MKTLTRFLALSGFVLSGLATAAEPSPASDSTATRNLSEILQSMKDYLGPEDTELLINYVRDSTLAALGRAEEPVLSPDLAFKVEILQARIKKEGAWYLQGLQQRLEKEVQAYNNPPPPKPYIPSYPQRWALPSPSQPPSPSLSPSR